MLAVPSLCFHSHYYRGKSKSKEGSSRAAADGDGGGDAGKGSGGGGSGGGVKAGQKAKRIVKPMAVPAKKGLFAVPGGVWRDVGFPSFSSIQPDIEAMCKDGSMVDVLRTY